MEIAVLGTGIVGRTIAGALARLGHRVRIGTRDVEATRGRTEPDAMGNPPFASWHQEHADVTLVPFADATEGADLVVLACSGDAALGVLESVGAERLAGMALLDVTNPLDFSGGFPPTLLVKDTDSLAEQIQRACPSARVVKSLNTMTASVMVDPRQLGSSSTVFVSGDDPEAKATVTGLLESLGHDDVLDLGDLSTARGAEMLLPLWLRLMGSLGTAQFNIKVVR